MLFRNIYQASITLSCTNQYIFNNIKVSNSLVDLEIYLFNWFTIYNVAEILLQLALNINQSINTIALLHSGSGITMIYISIFGFRKRVLTEHISSNKI